MTRGQGPKVRKLIHELNNVSEQRKRCLDTLWLLEEQGENKRLELMGLLNDLKR
jgi:hypothetical protein